MNGDGNSFQLSINSWVIERLITLRPPGYYVSFNIIATPAQAITWTNGPLAYVVWLLFLLVRH